MNARLDPLDQLAARLNALEERVQRLEHAGETASQVPLAPGATESVAAPGPESRAQVDSVFPVLGKALLGIAGAYVLRAVSGASLLPRTLVALMAALYAGAWLVAAARAPQRRKLAGVLYAIVSILVLAPMLAEMTIRFAAMQGTTACLILAVYVAAATALFLRGAGRHVFTVAFAGSAIAAVALSIATHAMAQFTFLLLAMLIFSVLQERKLETPGIRYMVTLAADAGVWTLLLIYRLPASSRADYAAVPAFVVLAASLLLFAVEFAAVARHVVIGNEPIPIVGAAQAMIAFAMAAAGLEWLAPHSAAVVLGSLCLALSVACYAVAYGRVRRAGPRRNFRVLSVWAIGMMLGAAFLLAQAALASAELGFIAVAIVATARRIQSKTLALHGVAFLLVASAGSGMFGWGAWVLTGSNPVAPGRAALAVAICALLAYAVCDEQRGEDEPSQALHMVFALLAGYATAALFVLGLFEATHLFLVPQAHHLALTRTVGLCILALGLAFAGTRLGRQAMVRTGYVVLAFVTAKLLFEDLRHGHMEFIAGSIFAVALTFIAAPRLTKSRTGNAEIQG